jgi:D-beta-D-heptose 7-phosphate kinase/D-beta-D-heptose 1-phosphate adenosyltransferase
MSDMPFSTDAMLLLVERFQTKQILVLGDLMLDQYWWGTVTRISPEAPVPVVHKQKSTVVPGGAANVAANVASLGGVPLLVGLVGDDGAAHDLRVALAHRGVSSEYLVSDDKRPTTVKTRVVAHGQHVVRVDDEDASPIAPALADRVASQVLALLPTVALLIISDYAKGLLTSELLDHVITAAREHGCRVVVDPKGSNYARYHGADLVCPNRLEALEASGLEPTTDMQRVGQHLLAKFPIAAVLITLGEAGMLLLEPDHQVVHISAVARTVYDVTGAGDTVMASLGLALAAGAELRSAAWLANIAAGLAVEQIGTTAVTAAQLIQTLWDRDYMAAATIKALAE